MAGLKRSPLVRKDPDTARLTIKAKKCKVCRTPFIPIRPMQIACGPLCAHAYAGKVAEGKAKQERKADKAKLAALKPLSHWAALAQKAINRYVRARDFGKGCISCHLPATWGGQWHASHLRSTAAAPSIRFNLWNIHKACSVCNNHKSGNIGEYFPRAVALIGVERVAWLYCQNGTAKYTREYLQRMASVFNRKAERQEKRNGDL